MQLTNKYQCWYYNIIQQAQSRTVDPEIIEKHHIIPKSLGGSNHDSNLVSLTPREHYICHLLLTKMYTGKEKQKMVYAFWAIVNLCNRYQMRKVTKGRIYESLRRAYIQLQKDKAGLSHPNRGKKTGRTSSDFTPEWKEKISAAKKGKSTWNKGIPVPAEQKSRQSATRKSKQGTHGFNVRPKCRPEKAKAISETQKGRKWVYYPPTNERKPVDPKDLDYYLINGWCLGQGVRKKSKTYAHSAGMKWVANPNTKETKLIPPNDITIYLNHGWILGRKL